MTAEEFLEMQATYESIHGITQPSEKVVLYNVALAALQLKSMKLSPIRNERMGMPGMW